MTGSAVIEAAGLSDVGLKRAHNEDSFVLADVADPDKTEGPFVTRTTAPSGALLVVADGMGGAAAGEVASRMAVEIMREKLGELLRSVHKVADLAQILTDASRHANAQIFAKGKANRALRGMGTTLTAALSVSDLLFVLQVGDSRAYVLRRGKLAQVTRDQSLVGQMIYEGKMSAEDARAKLPKNVILQAVGKKDVLEPVLTALELRSGDRLLLCSDGLSNLVRDDEIESLMAAAVDLRQACQVMIDIAKDRGGDDNITVVLATFKGDGLAPRTAWISISTCSHDAGKSGCSPARKRRTRCPRSSCRRRVMPKAWMPTTPATAPSSEDPPQR
ncbi:MAG: Stp1/IreP family PP2C-type Ser/Thr phosphatase [Acidobacteriota bacterium]